MYFIDLYRVVGTCYLNEQMEYCPILVQINHTLLRKEYDAEYLIQVWDRQGRKVYERPLKSKIRATIFGVEYFLFPFVCLISFCLDAIKTWAVSHEHFIYKP